MKCKNCGYEFGGSVYPLHVATSKLTRSNRILGVQDVAWGKYQWDLDYDTEDQDESDIIDESMECSYCGAALTEDEVIEILGEKHTWKSLL